jgi:putative ABC transport system permease protein
VFKNYLKITLRNLMRNKLYSAISVVGLSIGIACCLLILLYVQDELSFDGFHSNGDRIYRMILREGVEGELADGSSATSALLRSVLLETFPEVDRSTRISGAQSVASLDDKSFTEQVVHVDPDFFSMFSFNLLQGDAASVMDDPGSVVLTPETARKYFGDDNPIGRALSIQLGDTKREFTVSGVIEEAPRNSSIQYSMLISTDLLKYSVPEQYLQTWDIILFSTYVQLLPDADIAALEERISAHIGDLSGYTEDGVAVSYRFQPLTDVHLNPRYTGEMVPSSDPVYSWILSGIAFAVLLVACINFMTLAIGRASSRTREVGLRKVLGAKRAQLMRQFWGEALFLSFTALIIGIALTEAFLPTFNDLAHKQLSLGLFSSRSLLLALLALPFVTTLLSGIYPAVLLSKLLPVDALRGNLPLGSKNRLIQGLIVLQFAISVFLIICVFTMSSQIDYIRNADLGYDKELVVMFPTGTEGEEAADLLERFRTELLEQPAIIDVSGYSYRFGQSWLYINLSREGETTVLIGEDITGPSYASTASDRTIYFYVNWVDAHYIPTMGMQLADGRNFSEDHPSDVNGAIVINQTAATLLGMGDNPVGQKLPRGFNDATIVGVVEDFHYYPLHREIEPLVLHMPRNDNLSSIFEIGVRIQGSRIPATLALLEETWTGVSGGMPFSYEFLDDEVAAQYVSEERWRRIVQYSSELSILVTCLGLFGLTSLAVAKRTREVGIRKVLGASVGRVVMMFTGGFVGLIAIANIIAWPAAYFAMNSWLEGFAYRTGIGIVTFAITALLVAAVAALAISYQATRAALANPVDVLRQE